MKSLKFSELTAAELRSIATIIEKETVAYPWTQVEQVALSSAEQQQVEYITMRLRDDEMTLMNEATIWARAIYPMLMLAEQRPVRAWAQVPLRAHYSHVELQGVVDGVLGQGMTRLTGAVYYLVMVEAKRGLESQDPRLALGGQLLAAAHLNWECDQNPVQELFGCYTIVDTWRFVRAVVQGIESDVPELTLELSREYVQKFEAETILKLLKQIVVSYVGREQADQPGLLPDQGW